MKDLVIRPATVEDVPAMERLVLQNFPHLFSRSMHRQPEAVKEAVLIRLRLTRRAPVAGCYLATTADGAIAATMAYETREMVSRFDSTRLTALRPLGLLRAARFLLVARLTFITHRPRPGEVYVRTAVVAPMYRRMGVAGTLLRTIEAETRSLGGTRYTAWVASTNKASQRLLASNGYTPVYQRSHFWRGKLLDEPVLIFYEKPVVPNRSTGPGKERAKFPRYHQLSNKEG